MSVPTFPQDTDHLSKENVLNQILSSIAMEELGLAHVLNIEGEKMQFILGTLQGGASPEEPPTIDQVLEANESIRKTLDTILTQQIFLRAKMVDALCAYPDDGPRPV